MNMEGIGREKESGSFAFDITEAVRGEECLRDREYQREEITAAETYKAEMETVTFTRCRFVSCNFEKASFVKVNFDGCDFSNCRFTDCYFRDTRFQDCKGDGANFSESVFLRCVIERGSFYCSNFTRTLWDGSAVGEASMKHAFWPECRLKKVSFQRTDFSGADFFRTPLKGVDMSTCGIEGLAVSESLAELRGMKINVTQCADIAGLLGVKLI